MNIVLLVCGILFLVIAGLILFFASQMARSAREYDDMFHAAYLDEVKKYKEAHKEDE